MSLFSWTVCRYHLETYDDNWVAENIKHSLYSDNLVTGVSNEEEGRIYFTEAKNILNDAGMNLRQWMTNSEALQKIFDVATKDTSVLGLSWNTTRDVIGIKMVNTASLDEVLTEDGMRMA